MHAAIYWPIEKAGTIVVSYNNVQLLSRRCAAGERPKLSVITPEESGCARVFLVVDGEESLVAESNFYFGDLKAARMYIDEAEKLRLTWKNWAARRRLRKAIRLLERLAPDSQDMAIAYMDMSIAYVFCQSRKHNAERHLHEAMAFHKKAVDVVTRINARNGDAREGLMLSLELSERVLAIRPRGANPLPA